MASIYNVNRRRSTSDLRRGSSGGIAAGDLKNFHLRRNSFLTSPEDNGMWGQNGGESTGLLPGRTFLGPLILLVFAPLVVLISIFVLTERDGSLELFYKDVQRKGLHAFKAALRPWWDPFVWKIVVTFMSLQLALMRLVPGDRFKGPITATGHVPVYNANGMQVYTMTVGLFLWGAYQGTYRATILYDNIGPLISTMTIFAFALCGMLYLKGILNPSTADSGSTGNPVFDFYWGTELYPRIFGWDVKHFINCRVAMMFWPLYLISCLMKQQEVYGFVSSSLLVNVGLQLIYITKFFWWETGYLSSIDIIHDRAGFYIIWGVLVWLPCFYPSHTTYLVTHPHNLGLPISAIIFFAGVFCIYVNYDMDSQRQMFRERNGLCKIWGNDPFFIEAKYKTVSGDVKSSLLLGSGYWGMSRHFNYVPEIGACFFWTLPVWTTKLLPWFYVPYLVLLLSDRAVRDDARCASKYGKYWDQYCKRVRYLIIPELI